MAISRSHRNRYIFILAFLLSCGMWILSAVKMANMPPCPLCEIQEIAEGLLCLTFLAALFHNPRGVGVRIYAIMSLLFTSLGLTITIRLILLHGDKAAQACSLGLWYLLQALPLKSAFFTIWDSGGVCISLQTYVLRATLVQWSAGFFALIALISLWLIIKPKCK